MPRPLRIHVDVGHPAHVHFFRHAVAAWRERGHRVRLTSRDKDVALELLDAYGLEHRVLTTVGRGTAGLARELLRRVWRLRGELRRGRADVITAIGGGFIAPAGRLAGVPSVVWTDTEHVVSDRLLSDPWATVLCTPDCFRRDLGRRQVRYRGLQELAYLHPDRFTPDPAVLASHGLSPNEPFAVLRFVSWRAAHDAGHGGFREADKRALVRRLSQRMRVVLSSEAELPPDLEHHRLRLPPEHIHHLLAFANLTAGEGATLATESALLGTPALYVSSLAPTMGNFELLAEAGLVRCRTEGAAGVEAAMELAREAEDRRLWQRRRAAFLADRIDVTALIVRLVEAVARGARAAEIRDAVVSDAAAPSG